MKNIIYVSELPAGVFIETKNCFLVGTNQEGDVEDERLCPQEGK
ncbi:MULTISPECIES: hypothetical protein [Peribacillus]|nr:MULTISPECIES: hypothetical protein [unclassified Peribacillus]